VEIEPDFSRAQLDLGLVLAAQGDLAGAADHLRKATQGKDPEVAQRAARALAQIVKH
jgi:Flp pilus assembly protein TadD